MKTKFGMILGGLILAVGAAAQLSHSNTVDRAHAIKAASQLAVGMREEVAIEILATNGLSRPLKLGCSHGWTSFYTLSDRSSLGIEIRPKLARADGAWADSLVEAAVIQSNGSNIISIALTNRP